MGDRGFFVRAVSAAAPQRPLTPAEQFCLKWAEQEHKPAIERLKKHFSPIHVNVGFDPYTVEDGLSTWAQLHKRFGYPALADWGGMPASEYLCLVYVTYREGVEAVVDAYDENEKRKAEEQKRKAEDAAAQILGRRG